jgi:hypothetical protein
LEILRLERELANFVELELKLDLQNMIVFDRLNAEKITLYFMRLAKSSQKHDDLSVVKDKNGIDYESESDREKSITKFYERLYTDPDPNKDVKVEDIEKFLGETTGTNDVRKAKLTD